MITMIIIRKRNLTENKPDMNNANHDFQVYKDKFQKDKASTKDMVGNHMVNKIKIMVVISNNLHHMHSHIIMVIEDK